MEPFFLAEILMFAGNFAPRQTFFCHGQLLQISQHTALFSLLGTTYGGDGQTTFGLPDLRGRVPIGAGIGPGLSERRLGIKGGEYQHQVMESEMPSHQHSSNGALVAKGSQATESEAEELYPARTQLYTSSGSEVELAAPSGSVVAADSGGGLPHNNMQPYLAINYIIAYTGLYPSSS